MPQEKNTAVMRKMVPGVGVELFLRLILRNLLIILERKKPKKREKRQGGHVVGTPICRTCFLLQAGISIQDVSVLLGDSVGEDHGEALRAVGED
jgi:hypothetical protein